MRLVGALVRFSIYLLIGISCSVDATSSTQDPYKLDSAFRAKWDQATFDANKDPKAALAQLAVEIENIPDANIHEKLYAKLSIISLKLTFELSPEALADIQAIEKDVASLPEPIYQALLLLEKSRAYLNMGQYDQAYIDIQSSIKLFSAIDLPLEQAKAQFHRGQVYFHQEKYESALQDYLTVYKQFKSADKQTLLGTTVASIAQLYNKTGEHAKAIDYYKESLELLNIEEQKLYASIIYFNIGNAYELSKDLPQARQYYQQALKLSNELSDDIGQAYVFRELGEIAEQESDYPTAIDYFEKAYAILESKQSRRMMTSLSIHLANSYSMLDRHDKAVAFLDQAMSEATEIQVQEAIQKVHRTASLVFERKGDMSKALFHQRQYTEQLLENFEIERQRTLNEMKVRFDTENKEVQNRLLQKQNELNQLDIEKRDLYQKLLLVLVALAVLIVFFIYIGLKQQIKARKRFKILAHTDELTKAPNRRHILEYAEQQLAIAKQTGETLLIAMIDLDKFKQINDNYGHDIGDTVLINFYQCARSVLRQGDRLGRFGGEEWLLVLPNSSKEKIPDIFNRIRDAVNRKPLSNLQAPKLQERELKESGLDEQFKITFSLGIAQFNQGEALDAVISRADSAVYQAKDQGRDRWVFVE
jgi:diguanylate cyclase (GGDEF)-like protein